MTLPSSKRVSGGPKIIAFHSIILLSDGAAINPLGASSFMLQDEQQQRITIGGNVLVAIEVKDSTKKEHMSIFDCALKEKPNKPHKYTL